MGRVGEGVTQTTSQGQPGRSVDARRPCPICRSSDGTVLYKQRFEEFTAGSITDAYDVVACSECGMCFASGLPGDARISEYYGQSSKYDLSAEDAEVSSYDVKRHQDSAAFIATHVADRQGPILDIGTATGAFLLALRDIGFTSVHGVEPSHEAARKARESYGLDVVAGDTQTAIEKWDETFAVVSLVAVLEHLVDPGAALREIAKLLRADGLVYLLVPDASRFSDHLDAPYQEFSVEHINYFTVASLTNLLASIGFEVTVSRAITIKSTGDANGPAIELLCRPADRPASVTMDSDGVEDLRGYIERSADVEAGVLRRISELADEQSPIYVWGTGTNALHLLAASRLAECNIVAFLDSNPHYQGRQLAGRPVMAPRDVQEPKAPILVASAVSQTAIANAARRLFGPEVPLILMY
jgi:SAM-dependent methyltransferase